MAIHPWVGVLFFVFQGFYVPDQLHFKHASGHDRRRNYTISANMHGYKKYTITLNTWRRAVHYSISVCDKIFHRYINPNRPQSNKIQQGEVKKMR